MKNPFASRRDAETADLKRQLAEAAARHEATENKRLTLARWLAESRADNKRLTGRVNELSRRLDSAHDANLGELGDIARLEGRAVAAEARAGQLEKDVARLQARLDDAVGMPAGGLIEDSGRWQPSFKTPKPGVPS